MQGISGMITNLRYDPEKSIEGQSRPEASRTHDKDLMVHPDTRRLRIRAITMWTTSWVWEWVLRIYANSLKKTEMLCHFEKFAIQV